MKRKLNIGCGNDTDGTDFIDLYPQRKNVIKCAIDSERFPYKDNTFDKIKMYFVFEHLKNHEHALKEIFRVLKGGGEIDLKTDNASYWYYSLDNKTHTAGYESKLDYGKDDKHYGLFTDWHLKNYFEDSGFKVLKIINSYKSAIPNKGEKLSIRGMVVIAINYILTHIGPIRRMGCNEVQIIGIKE